MNDSGQAGEQPFDESGNVNSNISEWEADKAGIKLLEDRIHRFNSLLRTIRSVDQLIVKETDRERLIKGICDRLCQTHAYYNAWVVLLNEVQEFLTTAEAGLGEDFTPVIVGLQSGDFTYCSRKALKQPGVIVTRDPFSTCTGCLLSDKYAGNGSMTVRLEYGTRIYGLLSVAIPIDLISDEEKELLQEVSGEIAFALHNIEMEGETRRLDSELLETNAILEEEIADRKQAEEETKRLNAELMELNAVLEEEIDERKRAEEETQRLNSQLIETNVVLEEEISERKQAEEALRESEEKFRTIFEHANDVIIYVDKFANVIDANNKVEEKLGYNREDIIGKNFTEVDFVKPESMPVLVESFACAIEAGEAVGLTELEALHRDGSTVFLEASTKFVIKNGEMEGSLNIIRDITQRKQSEEETRRLNAELMELNAVLEEEITDRRSAEKETMRLNSELTGMNAVLEEEISERRRAEDEILQRNKELTALSAIAQSLTQSIDLDEILNNALDTALEILNIQNGVIALLNKDEGCLELTITRGASDEEIAAITPVRLDEGELLDIMGHSWEPIFIESLPDIIEAIPEKAVSLALENRLKSVMVAPLKSKGQVLGIMCTFTQDDRIFNLEERELMITVGHQIGAAIENAQLLEEVSKAEALEELDKLRTALLASISHELRTPLTSIKGIASSLIQPDIEWDTETQQDFLKSINQESDRLTHIVNDVMKMTQLEAGVMTMEMTHSSISSIIDQLDDQLTGLVKKHNLFIDVPRGLPAIYVDEIRLGEIITNLVANATAYSEEGTQITLEASQVGNEIIVSVADQGIGIPHEHLDKVFDRFYRLESAVARRRGGTGLGLAICKGIIDAHNGEIWVESKFGEGSRFSFKIRIAEQT